MPDRKLALRRKRELQVCQVHDARVKSNELLRPLDLVGQSVPPERY